MRTVKTDSNWSKIAKVEYCDCGEPCLYSDWVQGYDAYYCVKCNKWLCEKCSDPECEFCKDRPVKPLGEGKK